MVKKKMFHLPLLTATAVVLLSTHAAVSVAGDLIQNGSFETYAKDPATWSVAGAIDFNLGPGNTDIAGWTVVNGQIDYAQHSAYTWRAADGVCSIDLGGSPGSGGISQTLATSAGETYTVQFSMSGNPTTRWSGEDQPNKTLRVRAAGRSVDFAFDVAAAENSLEDMKWKLCTFTFVAESDSTTLEIFSTMDPVHIGPVIDNVSVVAAPNFSPAGSYMLTDTMGEEGLVTITPLGPDNARFAIVSDVINPGSEARNVARGELIRTGPDTYAATQLVYCTDAVAQITCRFVVSGTIVQTGPDTLEATWPGSSMFAPDQDPFADDATPLVCFPEVLASYQRIPVVAPCTAAPPPEGQ